MAHVIPLRFKRLRRRPGNQICFVTKQISSLSRQVRFPPDESSAPQEKIAKYGTRVFSASPEIRFPSAIITLKAPDTMSFAIQTGFMPDQSSCFTDETSLAVDQKFLATNEIVLVA